jgi:hypothetical protein
VHSGVQLPWPLQKLRLEQSQVGPSLASMHMPSVLQVAPFAQSVSSTQLVRHAPFWQTRWFGQAAALGQLHCPSLSQVQASWIVVSSMQNDSWH